MGRESYGSMDGLEIHAGLYFIYKDKQARNLGRNIPGCCKHWRQVSTYS